MARPWGVPWSGEASKPWKRRFWYRLLPCTSLRLTPAGCAPNADRTVPPCWTLRSSAERLCSAPGTRSDDRPISESGRVPYTTTCSVLSPAARLCAHAGVGSRAASSRARIFMLSPCLPKGLGEDRARRNFPISRRQWEFFPNVTFFSRAAKMPPSRERLRCRAFSKKNPMTLRGQFLLSIILALGLSLSVLGVVALGHARASVDNE